MVEDIDEDDFVIEFDDVLSFKLVKFDWVCWYSLFELCRWVSRVEEEEEERLERLRLDTPLKEDKALANNNYLHRNEWNWYEIDRIIFLDYVFIKVLSIRI